MIETASGLIVAANFPPQAGGLAEHAYRTVAHWTALGERVVVLAPDAPGAAVFDAGCGYPVVRFRLPAPGPGRGARRLVAMAWKTVGAARRLRADYLVCWHWEAKAALAVDLASCLLRIPYVLFAHGSEFVRPMRWAVLRRLAARRAARVVCVSEYVRSFVEREGAPRARLSVVPPGVDLAAIDAYRRRARTAAPGAVEAVFAPGAPTILTVCRLVPTKRVDRLIEAMPRIVAHVPAARCVVVGGGADAQRLLELAGASPVPGSVVFLGPLDGDAKWACFERCTALAMASAGEGFGTVFLEAAAFGRPSIAPRNVPESGAVLDGETGLLVDPDDVGALAEAAVRLLSDPVEARRLGDNARRRVETAFAWPVRVAESLAAVREACVRRSAGPAGGTG